MTSRPDALNRYFEATKDFLHDSPPASRSLHDLFQRVFAALEEADGDWNPPAREERAVESYLLPALETAQQNPKLEAMVQAFAPFASSIAWGPRPNADQVGQEFVEGHANGALVGPHGLERRRDVFVGASILAPNLSYPTHHHPPEEVYIVASEGEWQDGHGQWHHPGMAAYVHNPSNSPHAMRAGDKPLLAFWWLWTGEPR